MTNTTYIHKENKQKITLQHTSSTRSPAIPLTTSHKLFSVNESLIQKLMSLQQGGNCKNIIHCYCTKDSKYKSTSHQLISLQKLPGRTLSNFQLSTTIKYVYLNIQIQITNQPIQVRQYISYFAVPNMVQTIDKV